MTNERYRYEATPRSFMDRVRSVGSGLAEGYMAPVTDGTRESARRADLQRQATALIEESLKDAQATINYATLTPLVMEAIDTGEQPEAIIASLRKPYGLDDAAATRSQTLRGGIEQTPAPTPASPGAQPSRPGATGTTTERLRSLVDAATQAVTDAKTPEDRAIATAELSAAIKNYKDAADLAGGVVTLKDGLIITSAMLNDPDPAVRQQYQQAYSDRQTEIENDNAALLNQYNMGVYNAQRQGIADSNATAIASYNASMASIRERLARDEIDISRAAQEVSRAINGLQESRARTELETKTALEAAPMATTGGKTEFTGNDFGGAIAQLQRQGGGDPNSSVIKFPGVITLNPGASMAQRDAELGVSGPLATIPGLSVSDADIPRGVSLQSPGAIRLPEMVAPKPRQVIQMPQQPTPPSPYGPTGLAYTEAS